MTSAKPKLSIVQGNEMWIAWVPLRELATWPANPKAHDHQSLGESFERFGFIDPLIIDEGTGKLIAGHGRRERLIQMHADGMPAPGRVRVREADGEWLIPVLRGVRFENEHEAEAYLLANNQTVIKGGYNDELLAQMLQRHEEDLAGLGWDDTEVRKLVSSLEHDSSPPPAEAPQEFEEFDEGEKLTHACPRCGFHVVCTK